MRNVYSNAYITVRNCSHLRTLRVLWPSSVTVWSHELFALNITDGVKKMPDSKQDEIGDQLEEFGKCQQSEAEPEAEHSTKVRYVLYRLCTASSAKHYKCSNINKTTKQKQYKLTIQINYKAKATVRTCMSMVAQITITFFQHCLQIT